MVITRTNDVMSPLILRLLYINYPQPVYVCVCVCLVCIMCVWQLATNCRGLYCKLRGEGRYDTALGK